MPNSSISAKGGVGDKMGGSAELVFLLYISSSCIGRPWTIGMSAFGFPGIPSNPVYKNA